MVHHIEIVTGLPDLPKGSGTIGLLLALIYIWRIKKR